MISQEQLPRDANGIVQGAYRLLHEDPAFHGDIGVYELREGASVAPAFGRALICAIGEYGARLYVEPWGDLAEGVTLPELVSPHVPDDVAARFERCPWRTSSEETKAWSKVEKTEKVNDGLDALSLEQLRELATAAGIEVGNKQERALIKLLRRTSSEETKA